MSVEIYHNPRCSKSRQTLQLLQEQGIDANIREYLKSPPDRDTLESLLTMLRMEPRDLMRRREKAYQEAGLDNPQLSREQLIQAMIDQPQLIERPIVIHDGRAALGRPPEAVLDLF
jgi:arsenate reductase (glutaredoxin)